MDLSEKVIRVCHFILLSLKSTAKERYISLLMQTVVQISRNKDTEKDYDT